MTPVEFRGDLWRQKTRFPGVSCGVVCVNVCFAVLVEHRLVTDTDTDTGTDTRPWLVKSKKWAGRVPPGPIGSAANGIHMLHFDIVLIIILLQNRLDNILHFIRVIFTARCYASAVLAMGLCPSVCHKSVFYRNG